MLYTLFWIDRILVHCLALFRCLSVALFLCVVISIFPLFYSLPLPLPLRVVTCVNVFQFISARLVFRLVMLAGNCTAWSMVSSLMVVWLKKVLLVVVMIRSKPFSQRQAYFHFCDQVVDYCSALGHSLFPLLYGLYYLLRSLDWRWQIRSTHGVYGLGTNSSG
jgi:hypothetical protein